VDVSSGLLLWFIRGPTADRPDKMVCKVCFSVFIKTSSHGLQYVMNEHLNIMGIDADLPKGRSVVKLHSLSKTNQIISCWLTLKMETSCFTETSVSMITKQLTQYNKKETLDTQITAKRTSCLTNRVHSGVQLSYWTLYSVRR